MVPEWRKAVNTSDVLVRRLIKELYTTNPAKQLETPFCRALSARFVFYCVEVARLLFLGQQQSLPPFCLPCFSILPPETGCEITSRAWILRSCELLTIATCRRGSIDGVTGVGRA